jgi:hypothetical protein
LFGQTTYHLLGVPSNDGADARALLAAALSSPKIASWLLQA